MMKQRYIKTMMNEKKNTKTCSALIRLLLKIDGVDILRPGVSSLHMNVISSEYFVHGFKYSDCYNQEYYEMAMNQLKANPNRLLHMSNTSESGYYEFFGTMVCQMLLDEENQVVNCIWKIIGEPHFLQLSEDEVNLLKINKLI